MADIFDAAKRSWIMSRVVSKGTRPEQFIATSLRAAGIRFQTHRADLPGCPDFVFAGIRLAVFVDGCFWHWHGCPRCRMPASHQDYWEKKIARNIARDRQSRTELHRLGWRYVTVWECNLADGMKRCTRMVRKLTPNDRAR
jgi:DNA mismatch endonuclease (patch repair protein)